MQIYIGIKIVSLNYFLRLFLVLFLIAPLSYAHLMPAQNGTINIEGNSVFAAISVPISSLLHFDDDHDGKISNEELLLHQLAIEKEVDSRLMIKDGAIKGKTTWLNLIVNPPHISTEINRSDELLILKHTQFDGADGVKDLILDINFFRINPNDKPITIKATRGLRPTLASEVAIFTPLNHEHQFFRPAISVFFDYLQLGIEHVLTGTDHLIFLLVILASGLGIGYWLLVITGFTIAHSISLGLALLGYVKLPPHWVELAISLSIILVACTNLFASLKKRQLINSNVSRMLLVVGVCGLIHGLGFASAINAIGLNTSHQLISLFGFNIGIEIGQLIFLCLIFLTLSIIKHYFSQLTERYITICISIIALFFGLYWLVQRLI